jgi:hypothetical protein
MTNPEEVSRMMYEALKGMHAGWRHIRSYHNDLYGVGWDRWDASAAEAIQLYEQSITVDLEREEYERGEVESAQSIAHNNGESR